MPSELRKSSDAFSNSPTKFFPRLNESAGPWIMGILNVTPDSFSDGGLHNDLKKALNWAEQLVSDGASVIDVGGESSRPGAMPLCPKDEIQRVIPVLKALHQSHPELILSVDTWKSDVAKAALTVGARVINDISGLKFDSAMAKIASDSGAFVVLSHLTGNSFTELHRPLVPDEDPVRQVIQGLDAALQRANSEGIQRSKIILDPGIGFGKTTEQNLEILRRVAEIKNHFGLPILVGASRKRFLQAILECGTPRETTFGDGAIAALCAERGTDGLRVHDVKVALDAARVGARFRSQSS